MRVEDLKTVAQLGRALWADPRQADPMTAETVSAATLLELSEDREFERTLKALLDRASHPGMAANSAANFAFGKSARNPFFHLFPEERFLLMVLHTSCWSYERLGRILDLSAEEIEETVWGIRVKLSGLTPLGSPPTSQNCPEYDARHPWTQRFLDEEIRTNRERIFLQNHLMACASCQRSLTRCREIYYAVDKILPRLEDTPGDRGLLEGLQRLSRRGVLVKNPGQKTVLQGLEVFFRRRDVQLASTVLLALTAFLLTR